MGGEFPAGIVGIGNAIIAIATIGAGGIAFLRPRFTAKALGLVTDGSTEGLSELRAASGGLFIALGVAVLVLSSPWAPFMLGVAYVGAAVGRALGIVLDKAGTTKIWLFFLWEIGFAGWLIYVNAPLLT